MTAPSRKPADVLAAFFAPHELDVLSIVDRTLTLGTKATADDVVAARAALEHVSILFRGARACWREHAREHREATRRSSTSMPAVAEAAVELELARNATRNATGHAERAMASLSKISIGCEVPPRDET